MGNGHTREVFGGNDGAAILEFDPDERVVIKTWATERETFFDKLRARFGL